MPKLRVSPLVLAAGLLLWGSSSATAYPLLQLDIKNGSYNNVDETTYATSQAFTLYAYLTPTTGTSASQLATLLNDTYYISAAIAPKVEQPGAHLGTFTFNGAKVRATEDMVWGTPPLERYLGSSAGFDSGDLAKHDIYDTYFKEFSFKFASAQRADAYDTQTSNASEPTPNQQTGGMYYMAFQVDTTSLNPAYQVHFDMYSETLKTKTDLDINKFVPFSHDAQSQFGGGGGVGINSGHLPEPASLLLLGTGVVVMAARFRRNRTKPRHS